MPASQHDGSGRRDELDLRRRRLMFRCWHRGTQECDLILGSFAELSLAGFNGTQLDQLEALLDCSDADLFDWIIGRSEAPPQHDHDVMRLLRAFRETGRPRPARASDRSAGDSSAPESSN